MDLLMPPNSTLKVVGYSKAAKTHRQLELFFIDHVLTFGVMSIHGTLLSWCGTISM